MGELAFGVRKEGLVHKKLDKKELTNEYIYDMALKIVEKANENNILLRLLGATAFLYHCPNNREMYTKFKRELTDVDVVTYSRYKSTDIEKALSEIDFEKQRHYVWHAESREIYINKEGLFLDVFRDKLDFSHEVNFKNRLEIDNPTISVEDLLLEKLQIHQITPKDFKDVIILFLEHDLGSKDNREEIDKSYLASIFSNDWCFYYDATNNLNKIKNFANEFEILNKEEKEVVKNKIDQLLDIIEEKPKSKKWLRRAKKGTKKKWYKDVGEIQQGVE